MKKIAIIIPSLAGGGAERVVSELSIYLEKKSKVYIILFEDKKIDFSYGGEIINTFTSSKRNLFSKIVNSVKRINKIKKIKKEHDFDVVISFQRNANVVNLLYRGKERIIVSEHSLKTMNNLYFLIYTWFYKKLYQKANSIVVPSKEILNMLKDNYKISEKKIKIINNSINEKRIKILQQKEEEKGFFNKENFYIITAGRLEYPKGIWHLIKAFSLVNKKEKNTHLIILGSGRQRNDLMKLSENLRIKNISFLGFKENPYNYFYNSDLFVSSSIYESFGNVIVEAMACGLPVISTMSGGPEEIIVPRNLNNNIQKDFYFGKYGILMPPFSYKEDIYAPINYLEKKLSEVIIYLMKNKSMLNKYKQKSFERAKDFYSEKLMKNWDKLIYD